jgi:glycosyltransferase involved in cell wall biosynthesis
MSAIMVPIGVSIGIPTRNRSVYLLRAIRSALSQTYTDIEVVVSDNASTDDTLQAIETISDPRLVVLRQATNIGMAGNFNACLGAATGELFLMLSDDDVLEPSAIQRLVQPFSDPPAGLRAEDIGLSWCPCKTVNQEDELMWTTDGGPALEPSVQLLAGLYNGTRGPRLCSVMLRTADALSVGGYDGQRYGAVCDAGNWNRVILRYSHVCCVQQPLVHYTLHTGSVTNDSKSRDWQTWAENISADVTGYLRDHGRTGDEKILRSAARNMIANTITTIWIQRVGQPGWIGYLCREFVRARKYTFSSFVLRRVIRDGWKLVARANGTPPSPGLRVPVLVSSKSREGK